MSLVLWLVFSVLLGERALGLSPYLLFLTVAILPWWWFHKGMTACSKVFRRTRAELKISNYPTQFWVMRAVLVSTVEFVLSLPVILLALLLTQYWPGPWILLFPVGIAVQMFFMYGLGLFVASTAAVAPDVNRVVKIILRALFYLSPILYSISNIPAAAQTIAAINPLVGILGLYRIGWWPQEANSAVGYAISFSVLIAITVMGIVVFRRLEPRILKEA